MAMIKNKKGDLMQIFFYILIFGFIVSIGLLGSYVYIASLNDYALVPIQDAGINTFDNAEIDNAFINAGNSYEAIGWGYIDWLLGLVILIFIFVSLAISYKSKEVNYFSWLSILFYGLMFMLFLLSLIGLWTDYFIRLTNNLLPNFNINLPIFGFYMSKIGVISLLQMAGCLLVNLIDFDFSSIWNRKKKESKVFEDGEIV